MAASHRVVFAPEAERDLGDLYDYILKRSGAPEIAIGYIARIRSRCESLSVFPERGTRREDLGTGFRTMGFERRVTIVFALHRATVLILRIHYAGRSIGPPRT